MRTFTVADEENLVSRINAAEDRVVFIAPGLFESVADALIEKISSNGLRELKVVVDADEEVCRLGFGEIKAVRKLKDAADRYGFMLCSQPGLRIGVLLSDDDVLLWSPAPLLVEDQSHTAEKPNAIDLRGASIEALEKAVGSGDDEAIQLMGQEIGLDPLPEARMRETEKVLEEIPPKKFELSRQERVFSSKLEFVEMSVTQYRLSKKIMQIPSELMTLSKDKKTQERWRNQFTLFEEHACSVEIPYKGEKQTIDESFIDGERKRLDEQYLTTIPNYGKVIPLKLKQKFQKEIEEFKVLLKSYAETISVIITKYLEGEMTKLADELLPRFLENPPNDFKKKLLFDETDEEAARYYIASALNTACHKIEQHVSPKLNVVYKGITYGTFKTNDFVMKLNKQFGEGALRRILDEYNAARESEVGG